MANNFIKLQSKLMKNYYRDFSKYSKGRSPEHLVAWVTAFTPVEILEALDIDYYYPESYAAVIAASEMEQDLIKISERNELSCDCCSYSCCFNGSLDATVGPRGIPPKPDILIATNNQCNTLPNWWNVLSQRFEVPLFMLDYPGENNNISKEKLFEYVTEQHKDLISKLEGICGKTLKLDKVEELIEVSCLSVSAWKEASAWLAKKDIKPTTLFDNINYLITARCKPETSEMYKLFSEAMKKEEDITNDKIPVFWLGYPLWYHRKRYFEESMSAFQVVGSNYLTWWSLSYEGENVWVKLFNAYNYTFLNLTQESRDAKLKDLIHNSGAKGAIVVHNKSCKCDFVSAKNIDIPQAEVEIDMIDRTFADAEKIEMVLSLLKDAICTKLE